MRYVAIAFLAAALSGSAFAADAPVSAKADKPKKEKRVCKSFASSESRLGNVVCKTAAEWARQGDDDFTRGSSRTKSTSADN